MTRLVDENDMDVSLLVFEYRSGWKTWLPG